MSKHSKTWCAIFQRVNFFAKGLWTDRHLAQWLTIIMIMLHIGLGTAVISGGPQRMTAPAFEPLVNFVNGQTWIWGVWIIISALLMSAPFKWPNILGLWLGMLWHITWTSAFAIAASTSPSAAATGIPAYGAFAMIAAALLTARVIDSPKE